MPLPKRTIEFFDEVNGQKVRVVAKSFFEDKSVGIDLQAEYLGAYLVDGGNEVELSDEEDARLCEKAVDLYETWRREGRTSAGTTGV